MHNKLLPCDTIAVITTSKQVLMLTAKQSTDLASAHGKASPVMKSLNKRYSKTQENTCKLSVTVQSSIDWLKLVESSSFCHQKGVMACAGQAVASHGLCSQKRHSGRGGDGKQVLPAWTAPEAGCQLLQQQRHRDHTLPETYATAGIATVPRLSTWVL